MSVEKKKHRCIATEEAFRAGQRHDLHVYPRLVVGFDAMDISDADTVFQINAEEVLPPCLAEQT